jgi:hypothetical protein
VDGRYGKSSDIRVNSRAESCADTATRSHSKSTRRRSLSGRVTEGQRHPDAARRCTCERDGAM